MNTSGEQRRANQRGAPLSSVASLAEEREGRGSGQEPGSARRPPATWHRGRGHPTSEGPSAGVNPGDAPAGPLVRPYTMTRGRTRPGNEGRRLDLITIVMAARDRADRARDPELQAILTLCRRPISVAEISARLDIPLTVVKVLLGDLVAEGDVHTRAAAPVTQLPEKKVLQAVLDGIRRL
ncbi:DUF742 domain-containing protein [Nocardiopsis exhalans]|uniref:DUF742 domain-containing protein n=1 Tax=Nocardiopsis exhalans TaxID=163604 RepID=A0ABY5D4R5_9ACTN|nr:DUF742 domain-containing protein [Nocardiopsis exhalans]USY18204.1 DUF742 domain-containing protein [Nocardiopsis exhalans]